MEHKQLLRHLTCKTIVDIGANRGQFALAAHALVPEATIFSFEPLSAPARKFRQLFDGNRRVRFHQFAVGPIRSTAEIHVSQCDDSSSLLPMGELQEKIYPGTAEIRVEKVQVVTLSDVLSAADIESPALLKLDVQGYELETLKGCLDLLHCFTYAYVECSFVEFYRGQAFADDIVAFLQGQDFGLAGIYNLSYDSSGQALQGDFFFRRPAEPQPLFDDAFASSRCASMTTPVGR
jgi:FkbM family methyltransferase